MSAAPMRLPANRGVFTVARPGLPPRLVAVLMPSACEASRRPPAARRRLS
ncbi:hypothetical protein [Nonomuraea turkmeniaca]|nr:hypothetical protein [Nonomuraea turkmeniaca]